ncbi:unnamed protein product [Allacma fusca]|uniref:Uncharacterized protein n=1 Tax=Allacma fusca TaxID=39272 RepID=A0A8J2KIJ0_9HEXA|nr:unnamed protein product [Allacma fusca]
MFASQKSKASCSGNNSLSSSALFTLKDYKMRILVLLLVCVLGCAYAMPPRYYAVAVDDDDVDMEDEPFESFDDMFTFPSGGPGGPPSNQYLSDMPAYSGLARTDAEEDGGTYHLTIDPYSRYGEELDQGEGSVGTDLARRYKIVRKKPDKVEIQEIKNEEDEDEVEDEDEDDTEDDDGDQDDDTAADYSVPDLNELFPNPHDRPRGPGDYQKYVQHHPSSQSQRRPLRGNSGPPPPGRGSSSPSPPPGRGRSPSSPPPRRYRFSLPADSGESSEVYNTIIIEAEGEDGKFRAIDSSPVQVELDLDEDEDNEADVDDEEDSDDDVDFSVPSYDTLFPSPGTKPPGGIYSGMRNSWNHPPEPPRGRSTAGSYGRVLRLFQSPMLHDSYNPDYIINPQIAIERRNERMKNRYRDPNWRLLNVPNPYSYKPLLYQKGHWGNPREHDYNPMSGNHYIGGVYNGKTYY